MEASALDIRQLLLIGAGLALLAGLTALLVARTVARGTGFQPTLRGAATIAASDTGAGPSVLLSDPTLGLRGRPDYLLEEEGGRNSILVPLEIKPTRRSERLYESDAVQVGAYVIAARAALGARAASFGYVRYSERLFRVHLTDQLERRVRDIIAAIRIGRSRATVRRTHHVGARCARCAMRTYCDEALR